MFLTPFKGDFKGAQRKETLLCSAPAANVGGKMEISKCENLNCEKFTTIVQHSGGFSFELF